jgi:hypothetical protein
MSYNTRTKYVWHLYDDSTIENVHIGSRSFRTKALAEEWLERQHMEGLRKKYNFTTNHVAAHLYKVDGDMFQHLDTASFHLFKARDTHEELAPKPTE